MVHPARHQNIDAGFFVIIDRMNTLVNAHGGRTVYQACGDVVVVDHEQITVAHYGQLGAEIDAAAQASLSAVEKRAETERL